MKVLILIACFFVLIQISDCEKEGSKSSRKPTTTSSNYSLDSRWIMSTNFKSSISINNSSSVGNSGSASSTHGASSSHGGMNGSSAEGATPDKLRQTLKHLKEDTTRHIEDKKRQVQEYRAEAIRKWLIVRNEAFEVSKDSEKLKANVSRMAAAMKHVRERGAEHYAQAQSSAVVKGISEEMEKRREAEEWAMRAMQAIKHAENLAASSETKARKMLDNLKKAGISEGEEYKNSTKGIPKPPYRK